jgi:hypothetical protein
MLNAATPLRPTDSPASLTSFVQSQKHENTLSFVRVFWRWLFSYFINDVSQSCLHTFVQARKQEISFLRVFVFSALLESTETQQPESQNARYCSRKPEGRSRKDDTRRAFGDCR